MGGLVVALADGLAGGLASSSLVYLITLTCLSVRRRTPIRLFGPSCRTGAVRERSNRGRHA
ncbi:hypothetical protein [Nonomuraea fuscirosea]|uniref:hypothetical protein n=1 Tax=Nonomuraea fuscirosea TaxID=1291556 RepID=UPI00342674C5